MPETHFIISPVDATGSAARSAIAFHLRALTAQVAAAERGEREPIHQLRVATRRLRATLLLLAPYISALRPRQRDGQLKWISAQAGAVRELDVLEELIQSCARKLAAPARDLEPLWIELRRRRAKAAETLAASLRSTRFKSMIDRLSGPIPITANGDIEFRSVAAKLLEPILKSMLRAGERMHDEPTPAQLHRLRVRAKRSRYALETTLGFEDKHVSKVLRHLVDMQDLLGRYHDAAVAPQWISAFVKSSELSTNAAFACGALLESVRRRERKLQRRALREWRRLSEADPLAILKALEKAQPRGGSSDDALHHAARAG